MFDSSLDYTLAIDFEVFSANEMKSVVKMLYMSSSFCYDDICLLGENVIERMDRVGMDLRDRENRCLAQLVVETFNTLKKINPRGKVLVDLHDKFNHYMYSELEESPAVSPVKSPSPMINTVFEKVNVPKKMKKVFRK